MLFTQTFLPAWSYIPVYIRVAFTHLQNTSDDSSSASLSQARPWGICSLCCRLQAGAGWEGRRRSWWRRKHLAVQSVLYLLSQTLRCFQKQERGAPAHGHFASGLPYHSNFWFFQGALDKLQSILGRYEFQEPRVQNWCPQQTFQMESVADSFTLLPVNASFFFFFLEKALVFATWVTYGHMDSSLFNHSLSLLSLFGAKEVLISG